MANMGLIVPDDDLATLHNCGGYYSCPRSPDGKRLGPLVGYAGKYTAPDGSQEQFVGDVYANFAMAEENPEVLKFFAKCLVEKILKQLGGGSFDTLCGAPIGGYALSVALGLRLHYRTIKAEKKVTALATPQSRERSELVLGRHTIRENERYLIVEDICNNFSTTDQLIKLILNAGGKVVGIVCFLNRSLTVDKTYCSTGYPHPIPVISLVRLPINEWKQEDPAVAKDVAKGNVIWKPKDDWDELMFAMHTNKQK